VYGELTFRRRFRISERAQEAWIPAMQANAAAQNFEIVAVSDIWRLRREEGGAFLSKLTGKTVAQARNNDELYEMKDVREI